MKIKFVELKIYKYLSFDLDNNEKFNQAAIAIAETSLYRNIDNDN